MVYLVITDAGSTIITKGFACKEAELKHEITRQARFQLDAPTAKIEKIAGYTSLEGAEIIQKYTQEKG